MTVAEKEDVLTDPSYRELFLEAATWAFKQIEPNVTDEALEFIIPPGYRAGIQQWPYLRLFMNSI